MNKEDIGKGCRILMKDGWAKTGTIKSVSDKSVVLKYKTGATEEIFFDAVASIKVDA